MRLRTQLVAVSLLLLSLPWAGCQYLREMESTLLQGQGMATQATARAIAAALKERETLLYPARDRAQDKTYPEWYVPAASRPLIADGYEDDWREQPEIQSLPTDTTKVTVHAATRGERLFVLLRVDDQTLRYGTPERGVTPNGDRLELRCTDSLGALNRYIVGSEGPGALRGRSANGRSTAFSNSIRGAFRERAGGYAIEFVMPLDQRCQRLGLALIDASDDGEQRIYDSRNSFEGQSPWLIYQVPQLDAWLEAFSAAGRSITVWDHQQWTVGHQSLDSVAIAQDDDVFWLLRLAYRTALKRNRPTVASDRDTSVNAVGWQELAPVDGEARQLEARAEINRGTAYATADETAALGWVIVTETTERYLALTDRASSRVFGIGLAVLVLAFLGLLGYATRLSWRIRRLSAAAQNLSARALSAETFPERHAKDELGELSRSYSELLRQIGEYNSYLQGLARTLSHELRTPIAVVRSSLDHLGNTSATEPEHAVYRDRAATGLARLTRIVTAMSEASRIEESVEGASLEELNLTALIAALRPAYATTFTRCGFPDQTDPPELLVLGNGELLAQALDKVVDNAASFAPDDSDIDVYLDRSEADAHICVSNVGPLLPKTLRERLFEPMVSQRQGSDRSDTTHLGLGLHIARAIARAHNGHLQAANRADGSGVIFTFTLPLAPPGALNSTSAEST